MRQLIVFAAQYLYIVIIAIAVLAVIFIRADTKRRLLKLSILAFPLSFIIAKILNFFIYNSRPFVVEHVQPLIAHAADNGFPSDHTLLTATVAAVIFFYNRTVGIILLTLAIAVGVARVIAKVHHPIDILASILISIISTLTAWLVLKRYSKDIDSHS